MSTRRVCEYFAKCTNDADGTVTNPVLGPVPTCRRCADKMEQVLVPWPEPRGVAADEYERRLAGDPSRLLVEDVQARSDDARRRESGA